MSKTIITNTIETAIQTYYHGIDDYRTYPAGRVVEVGSTSALQSAVSNAQEGDTIRIVWPGVYNLTSTLVQNVPNLKIEGAGDSPEDIIIQGRGMDNQSYGGVPHGFYSQQPGLSIENITLEQFYYHGVTFGAGATSPTFINVVMRDIGQQFIKVSAFPDAINNGVVSTCRFEYTDGRPTTDHDGAGYFYGGFIDVHNSTGWVVQDSLFLELAPSEDEVIATDGLNRNLWSPAVYFWNRSTSPVVRRNVFVNCGRSVALGLIQRDAVNNIEHDCYGGVVQNNMCVVTPGRLSQYQIDRSDGQILLWDCPDGQAYHNTILVNGQIANSIQGRYSLGLLLRNNLADSSIRMRDGATFTESGNQMTAQSSWFVSPSTGNLRLNSTGNSSVNSVPRLPTVNYDIDQTLRSVNTKTGAHEYV